MVPRTPPAPQGTVPGAPPASTWSPTRPARNGACQRATTATSATARSTRSTPTNVMNLHVDHDVLDRGPARPRRPAARVRQHDVRGDAVSEQSHRRRSDEAGRRDEVDLRAASRFAVRRHRLLRRRQSRRVVRATARSSTACSMPRSSRSTPRPARRPGARKSATSTAARRSPARRSSSRTTCSWATPAASSACAAMSRASTSNTGKELWRAFNTGPDSDVKIGPAFHAFYAKDQGKDLGVTSWPSEQWKLGGSTVWGWISYDPETNLFFYGTGNPGVWNPDLRPGDNKWSSSIFARDADTGEAKWAYQVDRARLVGLRRDHGERARRHGLRRAAAQAARPSRPHRVRVRPRSRDRRAALRRDVPADELGQRLRPEDRQAARGSRKADALRQR